MRKFIESLKGKRATTIIVIAVFVVILALIGVLFKCCGSGKRDVSTNMVDFEAYIAAYTSGAISSNATIQVVLAQAPKAPGNAGEAAPSNLMKISPSVKGNLQWVNQRTLEFTPQKPLESGKEYRISLAVGKLFSDVPKQAETFTFAVRVLKQSVSLFSADYYISDTTGGHAVIRGEMYTADAASPEQLSKMISIKVDSKSLAVHVSTADSPNAFVFLSDPLPSGCQTAVVQCKPSDNSIMGFNDTKVVLPSSGNFEVINHYADDRTTQTLRVVFSQPLKSGQNLSGLVYGEGVIDPRYKIDGNILTVLPSNELKGDYVINLDQSIRASSGTPLKQNVECKVTFNGRDPQVSFVKNGYIVPTQGRVQIPIRTVGLRAVDVTVYKIFQSNLLYSFQDYSFTEYGGGLERIGKLLFRKTIPLDENSKGQNSVYTLDLTSLVDAEPGAMYRIGLSMRKELASTSTEPLAEVMLNESNYERWGFHSDYQTYMYDYDWMERDDPSTDSYYSYQGFTWRNVLVSNIGIIAKRNRANGIYCYTTNLTEGTPLSGVTLKLYSYQLQELASATSNGDGYASLEIPEGEDPFLIVAEQGGSRSYLNVRDAQDKLSYSTFEIDGIESQKGLQGYFYGDRGVWRPGDSIFMTLMVEDRLARLPEQHPVEFTLRSPRGQIVSRQVMQGNSMKMYTFRTATRPDAETGRYSIEARLGGTTFNQSVRVETIKPNRLKVKLTLDDDMLRAGAYTYAELSSAWLHGAKANGLDASVDAIFTTQEVPFTEYGQYVFTDEGDRSESVETNLYSSQLDDAGYARFNMQIPQLKMGSRVKVLFRSKVFEPGGGYTINMSNATYSPYPRYVGVQMPKHSSYYLETDTDQTFKVITLNADGKPQPNVRLKATVYKVNWSWWWEHDSQSLASYLSSGRAEQVGAPVDITTNENGKGQFPIRIDYPAWGRYLVRVADENGGHVSSQFVYWDWPDKYERDASRYGEDAKILTFESDKPKYEVGDKATLRIPAAQGSRLLVSIENGETVLRSMWVEAKSKSTEVSFEVTEEMAPNAYANVTLIQPYGQSVNDLPLRLYGAIPIMVENKHSHLTPTLKLPKEVRPESEFTAEVSEQNGKPMCFTLAIVDEGLLDITNFGTPAPWEYFHRKRALGIETYDFYDNVMGSYAGRITGVLNVGGDEYNADRQTQPQASRFTPVVRFYGPYELKGKESKKIKVQMPNYVGSVRVMAVAKNDKAQGSADATLPVRSPLMVQPTLPRVLGVNEQIDLPVSVFAMDNKIHDVTVKLEVNDVLSATTTTRSITFEEQGDQIVRFPIRTSEKTGIGKVKITASGSGEQASAELEIDVRNPNPRVVYMHSAMVKKGKSEQLEFTPLTDATDGAGTVEISRFPSMNYTRLLAYAEEYPYEGLEQKTTRALVRMLYGELVDVDKAAQKELSSKVQEFIGGLQRYQTAQGGFTQWPGYSREDYWTTNYVGHFLAEARSRGYAVPNSLFTKWKTYQQRTANAWSSSRAKDDPPLQQAYRLYTLAKAGQTQLGAMNRLRSVDPLPQSAARRLAAAYLAAGNNKIGKALLTQSEQPSAQVDLLLWYRCYGSELRDRAMLLEELAEFGELDKALTTLETIAVSLSSDSWLSSQEVGFSMLGAAKFAKASKASDSDLNGTLDINREKHSIKGNAPSYMVRFKPNQVSSGKISFSNKGEGTAFVTTTTTGTPIGACTQAANNNISLNVQYVTLGGASLAPDEIPQGTDFKIVVTVKNPGYKGELDQLALDVPLPSGWELRLASIEGNAPDEQSSFYYQDNRDDRVITYFGLSENQSKKFVFDVSASYAGEFVLPSVSCRALYDSQVSANSAGKIVRIQAR